MKTTRVMRLTLAMAMAGCACTGVAQTDAVDWAPIVVHNIKSDDCRLARNSDDLEKLLRAKGWRNETKDFPGIAWDKEVAVIVIAKYHRVALKGVDLSSAKLRVTVEESSFEGPGALVIQVPARYTSARSCDLAYINPPPGEQLVFYHARWPATATSADADEPATEPIQKDVAAVLDEYRPAQPQPTLNAITPPTAKKKK
jgi:hypothetical protein